MSVVKPLPIPLVIQSVYPTMESLTDVVAYAESCLPITDRNQLLNILFTYQNTLLCQLGSAPLNDC